MLTGDKIETAENIGFSAGLLDNSMEKFYIKEIEESKLLSDLEEMVVSIRKTSK